LIHVSFSKTESRYELLVDDRVAAFADYFQLGDGHAVELPHTVTHPEFRGQGLAAKLITHVLDDLRASNQKVVPTCSYVSHFIKSHPEHQDLLMDSPA
jgi:uncharacterized protein